jgi:hypothetical protein
VFLQTTEYAALLSIFGTYFSTLVQKNSKKLITKRKFNILRHFRISTCRGWEFFSSPMCPYRLWGPSILLPNG